MCLLFLCFFGIPVLLLGWLFWSFKKGFFAKITVGIFFILILALFIPMAVESEKPTGPWDDLVRSHIYYPTQAKYWSLVKDHFEGREAVWGVSWKNIGVNLIIREGYGDMWNEVVKAGKRI